MASSLEGNKLFAGVLIGGILAVGSGVVSGIVYAPEKLEENVFVVELPEGEATEAAEEVEIPIANLLAEASAEDGEGVARKCASCHQFEEGGSNGVGPALWGVLGRDIAGVDGFSYSDALQGLEGDWDFESMSAFVENPKGWAEGTSMSFAGIRDAEDRADLLVYLNSMSSSPLPLPEPQPIDEEPAAADEATDAG